MKLNFQTPEEVSVGSDYDKLKIEVKDLSVFKSQLTQKSVSPESFYDGTPTLIKAIPQQVPEAVRQQIS